MAGPSPSLRHRRTPERPLLPQEACSSMRRTSSSRKLRRWDEVLALKEQLLLAGQVRRGVPLTAENSAVAGAGRLYFAARVVRPEC